MEINTSRMHQIYKSNASAVPVRDGKKTQTAEAAGTAASKVDTVSISAQGAQLKNIGKATSEIAQELDGKTDPAKISALKAAIAAGEYNVSADRIADAILGGLVK